MRSGGGCLGIFGEHEGNNAFVKPVSSVYEGGQDKVCVVGQEDSTSDT